MKIEDIEILRRGDGGLYDLTQSTFKTSFDSIIYSRYQVQEGESMRIDTTCQNIYGNLDFIDIILNVNNIDNPLNIMVGDELIYPVNNISSLRFTDDPVSDSLKMLGNSTKIERKDSNRKKYIENNYLLPPTILRDRSDQFNVDSDKIILGDGLF
jgi:hypothetical protein